MFRFMGHFGAAGAPEVAGQSPLDTWSLNEELGFGGTIL